MTASNVFVIESSAKTGIPVAHVMPDGVSSERGRASTQNVARQKHGEIKYEGEAPEMRTEAIFADTESEALLHADMAKGNSMEGIINRVGLPEKHESAQSAISPGNVSAISAYETVRTMDHAFGIAESAESPDVRANVVAQLQEPVTRAINRGADNIRMRLQPEGLGELRVNIRMVDGGVRLEIITDKILSRQILEQGLPELQSLMREDGISLKNVRVEYGGADGGGDRETPRRRDEHPPYRHNNGNGKRRENFAGYFA
jgi:flagellar hook-length control protein FliK